MPSLREFRRRFARHVGTGLLAGTADGSSTRTYLADPTRRSSLSVGDDLVEWYLYRPEAATPRDQVRLVAQVDMDNGWYYGDFPPGDQWTVAPVAGEVYELLSPEFHPVEQLHDFINQALKFIRVPAEVSVPSLPGGVRQPVTEFVPWLTQGEWIYHVGALGGTVDRDVGRPYLHNLRGRVEESAGAVFLSVDSGIPASGTSLGALAAPVAEFATSATVAWSGTVPTPPFYLTLDLELLRVTSVLGSLCTLDRGLSTTVAASHPGGTAVLAPGTLWLHGLFPAYGLCRAAGGEYGEQEGLELDTDEAIPSDAWVTAGALKEAWMTAPQTMEQLAERLRIENLQQATVAFQRWQEQSARRMGHRTFTPYLEGVRL